MALELQALKIVLPLHHRIWMIPSDDVHVSGHLNRIVYQTPKGRRQTLAWAARVKIMQQLLQGKFGFDVRYAMSPQFELDDSDVEIPAEFIQPNERTSSLCEWGWECIQTGKQGRLPPLPICCK